LIITFFNFCSEEKPTEQLTSKEKSVLQKTNEAGDKISFSITGDSTKTDTAKIKDKEKNKDKGKGGGIVPNAPVCGVMDKQYWIMEKYLQIPNKRIGIWINQQFYNYEWLNKIKNYYSFSNLAVVWPLDNNPQTMINRIQLCESVGFSRYSDLMHIIPSKYNFWVTYDYIKDFLYHYTDEPLEIEEHTWSLTDLINASAAILSVRSDAKFLVGSADNQYTTFGSTLPYYLQFANLTPNSGMMYSDYESGIFNNINDQSEVWDFFKNYFGQTKVFTQWIGLDEDYHNLGNVEYGRLLEVANDHNYSLIWLYAGGASELYKVDIFCGYAFQKGWLNKFERLWIYTCECSKTNPCDYNQNDLADGWVLSNTYATSTTRITTR